MKHERVTRRSHARTSDAQHASPTRSDRGRVRADALATTRGGGAPLDHATRATMESRFGHDFGSVRVHADAAADASARALHASAYTVGSDIAFKSDRYAPHTSDGLSLLAHELTHVVQQEHAGSAAPSGDLEMSRPGDAAEAEARSVGASVAAGDAVAVQAAAPASVQREDDDSFLGDAWDFVTDDVVGGAIDFADAGGVGGMGTLGGVLGPLGVISGGMDMYENITGEGTFGLDNLVDTGRGAGNIFSGGVSTAVLAGLLPEVAGSTALGAIGAAGAGSVATAAGAVTSAGLAGYGVGRGLDIGTDWIGDQISGDPDADHSISGGLASVMTAADQGAVGIGRSLGILDEDAPEYTQTLGWQLAEVLPSWLQ